MARKTGRGDDTRSIGNLDPALVKRRPEEFVAAEADGGYQGALAKSGNRSRKPRKNERKLYADRLFIERLSKWRLSVDDLGVKTVRDRFAKLSSRLSEQTLSQLLDIAELIARAEAGKAAQNPKATGERYKNLCRTAVVAARLAKEIASMFPQPWESEQAPIGILVTGLASFLEGALHAATHNSRETVLGHRKARKMLQAARRPLNEKTGGTHWELIGNLVWLASGKRAHLSERTVRRYLEESNPPRIPEKDYWNSHAKDIGSALRLAPVRISEPFEMAALRYLTPLD